MAFYDLATEVTYPHSAVLDFSKVTNLPKLKERPSSGRNLKEFGAVS